MLFMALMASCGRVHRGQGALFSSDAGEVYVDSIVAGDTEYRALGPDCITNAWMAPAGMPATLSYESPQRMADALFAKAVWEGVEAVEDHLSTLDIFMGGAILAPQQSMESLRSMVADGKLHRDGFPVRLEEEAWAPAAWMVYCMTGDSAWLSEAYGVICATLRAEREVSLGMNEAVRGVPSHLEPVEDYYPRWMTPADLYQSQSTAASAWRYATLETCSRMAASLGFDREAADFAAEANDMRTCVNDLFWDPASASYGEYLYGDFFPVLSTVRDNMAGALCVIHGIATPEMGVLLTERRPECPYGVPVVWPALAGPNECPPMLQTMQGIAAAMTRNSGAFERSVGALWLRGVKAPVSLCWPSLLVRGMFGIMPKEDGMEVSPFVPAPFGGEKVIRGIVYRDAVLDIMVRGTGDRIASMTLDGEAVNTYVIPAGMHGNHSVEITLGGNTIPARDVRELPGAGVPDEPKLYWDTDSTFKIINYNRDLRYAMYVNGVLTENLTSERGTVSGAGTRVVAVVPVVDAATGYVGYTPRPHVVAPAACRISIPATSITPRRPPVHLIRDRELASRYIELAPRHNTRLTFYVQAPSEGDYYIDILYANGTVETAVRTLEVNGRKSGVLVCPPVKHNDWIHTRHSSTSMVHLRAGENKLSLYYVNSTILLNEIRLLKK